MIYEMIKTIGVQYIAPWAVFLSDVGAIATVLIGIYFYFTKKSQISLLYHALTGIRNQESFRDLFKKLDKLDSISIDNKEEKSTVRNTMADVLGHLKGNSTLQESVPEIIEQISQSLNGTIPLTEATKRQLTTELKEKIREITVIDVTKLSNMEK